MSRPGPLSTARRFELSTLDPAAPLDDLEPLRAVIDNDVRVVAIGESVHGAHEYYALRHRLIRLLVERCCFTAVAWESGFPEAFLVNDYIHVRRDDRDHALSQGMTMHMGRCQEMADLVDWLRKRNAAGPSPRVDFYGVDLPGTAATLKPALETVAEYVEAVDPGFQPRLARLQELVAAFGRDKAEQDDSKKLTLAGTAAIYQYAALPAADRNELTALLADLTARFDAMQRTYVERSDEDRYDLARQHLRVAAQLDVQLRAVAAFMAGDASACEANIRDATMADTVEWILRSHKRIIICAHNGHIQRTPISTMPGVTPVDTLGVHLSTRLGDEYVPIGTTVGRGEIIVPSTKVVDGKHETELVIRDLPPPPADTIDALLDDNFSAVTCLELRSPDSEAAAAINAKKRMRVLDQAVDINVRESFDLLIHVPRISLWTSETNAYLPDERTA